MMLPWLFHARPHNLFHVLFVDFHRSDVGRQIHTYRRYLHEHNYIHHQDYTVHYLASMDTIHRPEHLEQVLHHHQQQQSEHNFFHDISRQERILPPEPNRVTFAL